MGYINWASDGENEFFIIRNGDFYARIDNETTTIYKHTEEHSKLDHFFIGLEDDTCARVWRRLVERALGEDAFDNMALEMRSHGIEEKFMDKPIQEDIDAYEEQYDEEYKPLTKENIIDKLIRKTMEKFEDEWKYYFKEWI